MHFHSLRVLVLLLSLDIITLLLFLICVRETERKRKKERKKWCKNTTKKVLDAGGKIFHTFLYIDYSRWCAGEMMLKAKGK